MTIGGDILRNTCIGIGWVPPTDLSEEELGAWCFGRCDHIVDPVARDRAIDLVRVGIAAARGEDAAACARHLASAKQRCDGELR